MDMTIAITRRSFLSSLGVFAAASAMSRPMRAIAAVADNAPLPGYWLPHVDAVAGKVRALARETVDGFWFITDLHITANRRQSGKALVALAARTPIGKVLCGGDLPEAFAAKFKAAGGKAVICEHAEYGHHPHGVEPSEANIVLDFFRK